MYYFIMTKEFGFTTNLLVSKIRTAVVCNLRFSALAVFLMVEDITKKETLRKERKKWSGTREK